MKTALNRQALEALAKRFGLLTTPGTQWRWALRNLRKGKSLQDIGGMSDEFIDELFHMPGFRSDTAKGIEYGGAETTKPVRASKIVRGREAEVDFVETDRPMERHMHTHPGNWMEAEGRRPDSRYFFDRQNDRPGRLAGPSAPSPGDVQLWEVDENTTREFAEYKKIRDEIDAILSRRGDGDVPDEDWSRMRELKKMKYESGQPRADDNNRYPPWRATHQTIMVPDRGHESIYRRRPWGFRQVDTSRPLRHIDLLDYKTGEFMTPKQRTIQKIAQKIANIPDTRVDYDLGEAVGPSTGHALSNLMGMVGGGALGRQLVRAIQGRGGRAPGVILPTIAMLLGAYGGAEGSEALHNTLYPDYGIAGDDFPQALYDEGHAHNPKHYKGYHQNWGEGYLDMADVMTKSLTSPSEYIRDMWREMRIPREDFEFAAQRAPQTRQNQKRIERIRRALGAIDSIYGTNV